MGNHPHPRVKDSVTFDLGSPTWWSRGECEHGRPGQVVVKELTSGHQEVGVDPADCSCPLDEEPDAHLPGTGKGPARHTPSWTADTWQNNTTIYTFLYTVKISRAKCYLYLVYRIESF